MNLKTLTTLLITAIIVGCSTQYEAMKKDQEFTIQLAKDGMGGYVWKLKPNEHVVILNEYEETYFNDTTQLNERHKIFELKTIKNGRTELQFIKKRSFEPDSLIPSENHYFKKIRIK